MSALPTGIVTRPPFDVMRWSSVFAGLAVGLAVHLLLTLLGAAAGFSALGAGALGDSGAIRLAAATWNTLSVLTSAFFGGYMAARATGLARSSDGVLYGVVCWGATTLLFAALASTAWGTFGGGLFGHLQGTADTRFGTPAPEGALRELSSPRLPGADTAPTEHWQRYRVIRARQDAIADIKHRLSLSHERATHLVDQMMATDAMRLVQLQEGGSQSAAPRAEPVPEASPPAGDAPSATQTPPPRVVEQPTPAPYAGADSRDEIARPLHEAASVATWWLFAATLGSLLAAIAGGSLGAKGTRRRLPRRDLADAAIV